MTDRPTATERRVEQGPAGPRSLRPAEERLHYMRRAYAEDSNNRFLLAVKPSEILIRIQVF